MRASLVSRLLSLCALVLTFPACMGTTGDQMVDFEAIASGPADAAAGEPLSFDAAHGWQVTLTSARLHIGALYLAGATPDVDEEGSSCSLPGDYVAQVVQGREIDLLSGEAQPFPTLGRGTTLEAHSAQVWLSGGDVNLTNDPTPATVILQLSGSAQHEGELRPFTAQLTIAENRVASGSSAICNERIVSPIPAAIQLHSGGALWLRVDPRRLFTNVDFGALEAQGNVYVFKDDSSDEPSAQLYQNLTQDSGLYDFSWVAAKP